MERKRERERERKKVRKVHKFHKEKLNRKPVDALGLVLRRGQYGLVPRVTRGGPFVAIDGPLGKDRAPRYLGAPAATSVTPATPATSAKSVTSVTAATSVAAIADVAHTPADPAGAGRPQAVT
jgi:hypothetical protein